MQFARFVIVGVANTAASYAVYLILLLVFDYRVAYTIAYLAGLAGGYLAHARLVFGAQPGVRSAASYVATYGAMYLASLLVLYVAVDRLAVPTIFGMLVALAFTVPVSFLLLRRGFRRSTSSARITRKRAGAADDPEEH
jgi:putative flippase GtrA